MKRTYSFARKTGTVSCPLEGGGEVVLPVFQGILKHLPEDDLENLLADPEIARKYTRRALQMAAWPILREFPRNWLLECMGRTELRPGRRKAIEFMLAV